ncbi:MAG: MaoC family dehydratase [Rhodococcus sp. (in: high G+C Gram-positive bacteria)]|uniref:MaoC family dehydratase n=1 Tax=Rhodococcus sp. TaxID=1831 RepID=UPI003BB1A3E6
MRVFNDVDELVGAVGDHLGYGPWLEITQDRIDRFADATDDWQWIHVDPDRAADGPFGATIAHGYLTESLIPKLAEDIFRVDNVRMGINYGSNKVRFPHPVRAGSRVRAGATLVAAQHTPNGVQAVITIIVEIEDASKPACIAETVRLLVP